MYVSIGTNTRDRPSFGEQRAEKTLKPTVLLSFLSWGFGAEFGHRSCLSRDKRGGVEGAMVPAKNPILYYMYHATPSNPTPGNLCSRSRPAVCFFFLSLAWLQRKKKSTIGLVLVPTSETSAFGGSRDVSSFDAERSRAATLFFLVRRNRVLLVRLHHGRVVRRWRLWYLLK